MRMFWIFFRLRLRLRVKYAEELCNDDEMMGERTRIVKSHKVNND